MPSASQATASQTTRQRPTRPRGSSNSQRCHPAEVRLTFRRTDGSSWSEIALFLASVSDSSIRVVTENPLNREAHLTVSIQLVVEEGWTPHPSRDEVDGQTLYFCPVSQGIFTRTVEQDNATGQIRQLGWATPEIASLEALRKARFAEGK